VGDGLAERHRFVGLDHDRLRLFQLFGVVVRGTRFDRVGLGVLDGWFIGGFDCEFDLDDGLGIHLLRVGSIGSLRFRGGGSLLRGERLRE
jgi:hypothetical protein